VKGIYFVKYKQMRHIIYGKSSPHIQLSVTIKRIEIRCFKIFEPERERERERERDKENTQGTS
jgi:hypothetical protein